MANTDKTTKAFEAASAHTGGGAEKAPGQAGAGHRFNIRFGIWTPAGRLYMALLGGRERRPKDRRREDRERHPLWTRDNVRLATVIGLIFFAASVIVLATGQYMVFLGAWHMGSVD